MQIQKANETHIEQLALLFNGYRMFYEQADNPEACTSFMRDRITNGDSVILVAIEEGRLAGFTQLYPMFTSVGLGKTYLLNDLFVAPDFRKKGVGRALLDEAAGFARTQGAVRMHLETGADNDSAQSLYEKVGWIKEEGVYHYDFNL